MTSKSGGFAELLRYLRETARIVSPYWTSDKKASAWIFLAITVCVNFTGVLIAAKLSFYYADMMDALSGRQVSDFYRLGLTYLGILGIMLIAVVVQTHASNMLTIGWRWWLTNRFLDDYLGGRLYNQLELKDYGIDNPDQRLSMDIGALCEETLSIGLDFLTNFTRVFTFGAILWTVSGPLKFTALGVPIVIPGYMLWVSVVYSALVTWALHALLRPMTRLEFERQGVEADFRFRLVRVRDNAESIALIGGEAREKAALDGLFNAIYGNWVDLLRYKRRATAFQGGVGQLTPIFPLVAGMPGYLAGNVTFGGLLQLGGAFSNVTTSLEWFVNRYQLLAQWKARVDRVLTFESALKVAELEQAASGFRYSSRSGKNLDIDDLVVTLPNGETLLNAVNLNIERGDRVLVSGTSGAGKSTLFRAISGLWVWGEGHVSVPDGPVMFVPQKPYLPTASFRDAACYPRDSAQFTDAEIQEVMRACRLEIFCDRLDETENWSRLLSGGEQQRVAFVRAVLARPDWLFLDEATSALDRETEMALFGALKHFLPDTTLVSISHHASPANDQQLFGKQLLLDSDSKSVTLVPYAR